MQSLGQVQKQETVLTPQQIQLMKLLQVTTAMIDQRVDTELEINPALEQNEDTMEVEETYGDDYGIPGARETKDEKKNDDQEDYDPTDEIDFSDYIFDDDSVGSYRLKSDNYGDVEDENKAIPIAVRGTFHEHLMEQVGMLKLPENETVIIKQLVGSIDEGGYLRRELEAIVDDLAFSQNVTATEEELEELLKIVQRFDPPGVGARDLQECLLIQIRWKDNVVGNKYLEIAEDILENHFEEFAKKHYDKLLRTMSISTQDLKNAVDEILKLNPKPGSAFSGSLKPETYIIPDFLINHTGAKLALSLNSKNAPDLRISDTYRDMLKEYAKVKKKTKAQKAAVMFIKQKIDSAKWFIEAIRQRQDTMLKTMQAILDYQYDYFFSGDELKLRPMILKDIAEITGLDISTVSRVSNSKYVQTEFGTFKLKYFFSESLKTDSGEDVSTREVKKVLSNFIEAENKRKPLSDQKLTE
ncbi:MAG: RNA polymerase factor sigma-54, partial [Chitinophagales bacterium]